MRLDRLRDVRQTQRAAVGVHLSFLCPEAVEFYGLLGFDWVFLDAEHAPLNAHLCRDLVRAADVVGVPCLVRVPQIKAAVVESYLDVGVLGIMAPNVATAADAQRLVRAVKFSPDGERGAAGKSRAVNYGLTHSPSEGCRQANQATFTVALIETRQGVDNLESIMAVPGIDYIAIGANDLGLSLGIDRGMADATVRAVVENAQARIAACGKPQMAVVNDADQARAAAAAGVRLIAVPDAVLLANAGRSFLEKARA